MKALQAAYMMLEETGTAAQYDLILYCPLSSQKVVKEVKLYDLTSELAVTPPALYLFEKGSVKFGELIYKYAGHELYYNSYWDEEDKTYERGLYLLTSISKIE